MASVVDVLSPDAPDDCSAAFAAENGWVVFANDDDCYGETIPHGSPVSARVEDPNPGDVVTAVRAIDAAYPSIHEIDEGRPERRRARSRSGTGRGDEIDEGRSERVAPTGSSGPLFHS